MLSARCSSASALWRCHLRRRCHPCVAHNPSIGTAVVRGAVFGMRACLLAAVAHGSRIEAANLLASMLLASGCQWQADVALGPGALLQKLYVWRRYCTFACTICVLAALACQGGFRRWEDVCCPVAHWHFQQWQARICAQRKDASSDTLHCNGLDLIRFQARA